MDSAATLLHWTLESRAKLNLNLAVIGRRADGYHELSSLFAYCDWADQLVVQQRPGVNSIECDVTGPQAPDNLSAQQNLAVRAYDFAVGQLGALPAVRLTLHKNIPAGAGLGGGSGNAATMLRWAYGIAGRDLPAFDDPAVALMRSALGADTFPILEGRSRFWSGTGDVPGALLELSTPLYVLVVFPNAHVSTRAIFGSINQYSAPLAGVGLDSGVDWRQALLAGNDLQAPACQDSPQINQLIDALHAACSTTGSAKDDAIQVQMTGSGSACFAVFQSEHRAREAAQHPDLVKLPQHVGPLRLSAWE